MREVVEPRLEALLGRTASATGGKQRLTATRLHRMLVSDGVRVGVTLVKELMAERKRRAQEVFVPLVYRPGDLGEVDFFEGAGGRGRRAQQGVDAPTLSDACFREWDDHPWIDAARTRLLGSYRELP